MLEHHLPLSLSLSLSLDIVNVMFTRAFLGVDLATNLFLNAHFLPLTVTAKHTMKATNPAIYNVCFSIVIKLFLCVLCLKCLYTFMPFTVSFHCFGLSTRGSLNKIIYTMIDTADIWENQLIIAEPKYLENKNNDLGIHEVNVWGAQGKTKIPLILINLLEWKLQQNG